MCRNYNDEIYFQLCDRRVYPPIVEIPIVEILYVSPTVSQCKCFLLAKNKKCHILL
jgi:hypothetical protein